MRRKHAQPRRRRSNDHETASSRPHDARSWRLRALVVLNLAGNKLEGHVPLRVHELTNIWQYVWRRRHELQLMHQVTVLNTASRHGAPLRWAAPCYHAVDQKPCRQLIAGGWAGLGGPNAQWLSRMSRLSKL